MRPSWFSSLGKDVYEPALKKLDELVGLSEIKFKIPAGHVTVHWCDPKKVLLSGEEVRAGGARVISRGSDRWEVEISCGSSRPEFVFTRKIIVAAGIWTKLLVPEVDVVGQAGVAWLWPYGTILEPKVKVWAPYKQLVAFNRGDGLWVGDGLSLRNWSAAYDAVSLARCREFIHLDKSLVNEQPKRLFGYRPYVKEAKPCCLKEVNKGLWVATGGAKNGTLAAGWCADQLVRALA
jgi:hypothetical protein